MLLAINVFSSRVYYRMFDMNVKLNMNVEQDVCMITIDVPEQHFSSSYESQGTVQVFVLCIG